MNLDEIDLDKIGVRIRNMRESLGLSQEALAQKAGLSKNHISNVERGIGENVGLGTFKSIAIAVEAPLSFILFGDLYAPNTAQYQALQAKVSPGSELLPLAPDEREILLDLRAVESKKQRATIKDIVKSWSSRGK